MSVISDLKQSIDEVIKKIEKLKKKLIVYEINSILYEKFPATERSIANVLNQNYPTDKLYQVNYVCKLIYLLTKMNNYMGTFIIGLNIGTYTSNVIKTEEIQLLFSLNEEIENELEMLEIKFNTHLETELEGITVEELDKDSYKNLMIVIVAVLLKLNKKNMTEEKYKFYINKFSYEILVTDTSELDSKSTDNFYKMPTTYFLTPHTEYNSLAESISQIFPQITNVTNFDELCKMLSNQNKKYGIVEIFTSTDEPKEFKLKSLIDKQYATKIGLWQDPDCGLNQKYLDRFNTINKLKSNAADGTDTITFYNKEFTTSSQNVYIIFETQNKLDYRVLEKNGKIEVPSFLVNNIGLHKKLENYNKCLESAIIPFISNPIITHYIPPQNIDIYKTIIPFIADKLLKTWSHKTANFTTEQLLATYIMSGELGNKLLQVVPAFINEVSPNEVELINKKKLYPEVASSIYSKLIPMVNQFNSFFIKDYQSGWQRRVRSEKLTKKLCMEVGTDIINTALKGTITKKTNVHIIFLAKTRMVLAALNRL